MLRNASRVQLAPRELWPRNGRETPFLDAVLRAALDQAGNPGKRRWLERLLASKESAAFNPADYEELTTAPAATRSPRRSRRRSSSA